jgi:hypothetical protein
MADANVVPMSDVTHRASAEDRFMAQHLHHHRRATPDERAFLDTLIFLRGLYAERGPRDQAPVASIEVIVADAERRMRAFRFEASA